MSMRPDPRDALKLRVSDAERERVATLLRDNYSEGRLTLEEFQERLERAYEARTQGDLVALTRNLPVEHTWARPVSRGPGLPPEIIWTPAGNSNWIAVQRCR